MRTRELPPARIAWTTSLFVYFPAFIALMYTNISIMLRSMETRRLWEKTLVLLSVSVLSFLYYLSFNYSKTSGALIIGMAVKYLYDSLQVLIILARRWMCWEGSISGKGCNVASQWTKEEVCH